MQLLTFNTTLKEATLHTSDGKLDQVWKNVPTVKVQDGYYEVMQKVDDDDLSISASRSNPALSRSIPVFRCPIANTNMRIEK